MTLAIPDELLARFRAVAMERLERIDTAWTALVRGEVDPADDAALLREVHTLKGDAKVVGLPEASLLCQRLEDLLSAARARRYRVHEDVDIVVTMTIQFVSMLVRKRGTKGGIDLKGFLKQVEEVMGDWLRRSSEAPHQKLSIGPRLRVKDRERIDESSGLRLSSATTAVYLEHLRVPGDAGARLHTTFLELLAGVLEAHRIPFAPMVHGHVVTAKEIAGALGKRVEVTISGDATLVLPEAADTLGVVLLHALRNAVDHGIEPPAARKAANKPEAGAIDVALSRDGDVIELVVRDDGAGIDVEHVRRRAVERGLLSPAVAEHAPASTMIECLFASGFSTRDATSEISGRGIGLDAVHAAVAELGGTIALEPTPGGGATLRATVNDARGGIDVVCFAGGRSGTRFAVPATYGVKRALGSPGIALEEVLRIPEARAKAPAVLSVHGRGIAIPIEAGGTGTVERALRRCPTAPDELCEIVWVGGEEVVLVRPEVLHGRLASD